ncbi:uncharacterized protein LOC144144596 [Haemaphysalis longicornis]
MHDYISAYAVSQQLRDVMARLRLSVARRIAEASRTVLTTARVFRCDVFLLAVTVTGLLLLPVTFRSDIFGFWHRAIMEKTSENASLAIPSSLESSSPKPSSSKIFSTDYSSVGLSIGEGSNTKESVFPSSAGNLRSKNEQHLQMTPYKMDTAKQGGVQRYSTASIHIKPTSADLAYEKPAHLNLTSNMSTTVAPAAISTNPTASSTTMKAHGWKVKRSCSSRLRVLYYVHTAPDHVDRRDLLRSTIGKEEVAAFVNSSLVFFVGTTPDQKLREKVHEEAERYGDLVELDFIDTYRNLTHKFIGATKWLTANDCLNSSERVVVKLDDDVMVNVFLLTSYVEYMLALDPLVSPSIHCYTLWREGPIRKKNSKWFVSRQEYRSFRYPPYCVGAAFMMHAPVLALLGRAAHNVPFFWVDDVYATGMVARSAKVDFNNIQRHYYLAPTENTVTIGKNTLFLHMGQQPVLFKRADKLWESMMMHNQMLQ